MMKRLSLLFIFILLYSCGAKKANISEVDWLLGKWKRVNDNNDFQTYEFWEMGRDDQLKGIGFSLQGKDTTFVERLTIEERDGQLYYIADTRENDDPVAFKFASLSNNQFVSENPEHDFPKMITYLLEGDRMTASISDGASQKVDFVFVRMK